jgi:hypothetical protein
MTRNIITTIALGLITTLSFAQYKVEVKEQSANIADGNHSAFTIMVYEADKKLVEKDWKKELKGMGAKVKSGKEMLGDDATMGAMGANSFDVYSIFNEVDGGVELTVAIDLGGAFLSSSQNQDKAKVMSNFLRNFAIETAREAIRELVKKEEEVLKEKEKEQAGLLKDKQKLENGITANEALIEQAKTDIEQGKKDIEANNKDQETTKQQIEAQKTVVTETAAKEAAVK